MDRLPLVYKKYILSMPLFNTLKYSLILFLKVPYCPAFRVGDNFFDFLKIVRYIITYSLQIQKCIVGFIPET
jgi:hypothetical protein